MATSKKRKAAPDERARLVAKLSKELGVPAREVELRALRELAGRLGERERASSVEAPRSAPAATKRLFLEIDGYGLPLEVIDLPATVGSGRRCTVWVNAPRVETRHLQITRDGDAYLVEDLRTEHGTFLRDERIERRIVQSGDEFRLAGYVKVRAELR